MTTSTHPDDLDLFDYVEGDLDETRTAVVAEHVASCPSCAEQVRLLEAGKAALRESPLLELPTGRQDAILADLPRRQDRRPGLSPKRLVAILTPVAAVLAVVVVLTNSNTGSETAEKAAAPSAAEPERSSAAGAAAEAPPGEAQADAAASALQETAGEPIRRVTGPPSEVVRLLVEAGLDAKATEAGVEVTGADPADVERVLVSRPAGDVAVYVR